MQKKITQTPSAAQLVLDIVQKYRCIPWHPHLHVVLSTLRRCYAVSGLIFLAREGKSGSTDGQIVANHEQHGSGPHMLFAVQKRRGCTRIPVVETNTSTPTAANIPIRGTLTTFSTTPALLLHPPPSTLRRLSNRGIPPPVAALHPLRNQFISALNRGLMNTLVPTL